MESQFAGGFPASVAAVSGGSFSFRTDIDHMPEAPHRVAHHRRAHSETAFYRFPDDIGLDADADADFNFAAAFELLPDSADGCSSGNNVGSGNTAAAAAVDSSASGSDVGLEKTKLQRHIRSLSVDNDFFEGLVAASNSGGTCAAADDGAQPVQKRGSQHRHSLSMDGVTTSFEAESTMMMMMDGEKKASASNRLAELALIDPKRAKRILANRQSAARSKERKVRYTSELERKVQTLQTEATTLSAQVTMLQRDATGLSTENKELLMRLQALEQQAHLRDALNEALREEVQRLKIATGEASSINSGNFNRSLPPQYSSNPQPQSYFGGHKQQHLPTAHSLPTTTRSTTGTPNLAS